MPTTIEHIKGSELPEKVARQLCVSPERLYTITIDVMEEQSSAALREWKQALGKATGLWEDRPDIMEEMEEIRKECDRSFSDQ